MKRSERAAGRKYHYIYKTTCLVTGKYYIGMHSTNDLEDGYMGSGVYLWRSIDKHGLDNHKLEILEQLPSRASLKAREAELVNEELLQDPMCMNLKLGGEGGWEYCNGKHNNLGNKRKTGNYGWKKGFDPLNGEHIQKLSSSLKKRYANESHPWLGRTHSPESKAKISATKRGKYQGISNPSAGKPWVYHPELKQCKKIHAEELEVYLAEGWLKGRKMKF